MGAGLIDEKSFYVETPEDVSRAHSASRSRYVAGGKTLDQSRLRLRIRHRAGVALPKLKSDG